MSALSKGQFDKSVRWLERALESSSWTGQQGEQPDLALKDMRLLALHAFGEFCLPNYFDYIGDMFMAVSSSTPSTERIRFVEPYIPEPELA